ncbi:TetR/AcrR family transcriptional regulator [Microbacterium fluvii]|uniref:TetR/AcrR family transcriptional regulator n=1 Tax=Microbacterium fluvii TaxID=415215 RepID=A0ABW2HH17_9MICO|nr:TetR/AcrR family transcriptional regulator [Microbacterium fluvii]MCU4673913.1 TetR/AcrR family transcriptional regulator [Microbacterium fluvii]
MAAHDGLSRAERAEQTRSRIVEAARDVFIERGYRAASLRDVAAAAGISHPGLLKHFGSKELLLEAVVAAFESANEADLLGSPEFADPADELPYMKVARRNATLPGYLPLFAALAGEASAHGHPSHERMRQRYARLREMSSDLLEEAVAHGLVAADRDPLGESIRLAAAWDGLQMLQQYLPERVDLVGLLDGHQHALARPLGWRDEASLPAAADAASVPPVPALGSTFLPVESGYRVGRERRAQILADATALFAREGYGDTSLREIAEAVGISKSTLLHHFATKDELLRAVLAVRDQSVSGRAESARADAAADVLRDLPLGAQSNTDDQPGLVEVYAVLSCEAVPIDHPAHEYFRQRFDEAVDYFAAMLRGAQAAGDLPAHRDPESEAVWLIALWDGLQYQWLYDRDAVDVAAQLAAHLADVLPARVPVGTSPTGQLAAMTSSTASP